VASVAERAFEVIGREAEIASVTAWIAERHALPAAIVLEGEAGMGKTTLWRHGIELASSAYSVLTASPSEWESQLAFAALGDLLEPVLDDVLATLPKPQRTGLAVALLREEVRDPPPDPHAIALAFLEGVRTLSLRGPLLIAVDDVQWLDEPSAITLDFAIRRLRHEPVLILCGRRSGDGQSSLSLDRALGEDRVRRLAVGPLSVGAVHRLLNDRLGLQLSRPRARRVHQLSGGNPFFALEFGRALQRGTVHLEAGEPLPHSLASLVEDRLASLPDEARATLLAAAVLSHPTAALVARMVADDSSTGLTAARQSHVIELDGDRIRFTHPLLASAVYAAADRADRNALHRRAAVLVGEEDERARHLALGTEGPDAAVADALEEAARRADLRGALAIAADLSAEAMRLTPADQEDARHRRTIQAANHAFDEGENARSRLLLEEALADAPPGWRAEILYWLGHSHHYEGDRRVAVDMYRTALAEAGEDISLKARLHSGLADALFLMRTDLTTAAEHARSAVDLAEQIGDPSALIEALSTRGLVDAIIGGTEWREIFARAAALARDRDRIRLLATPAYCLAVDLTWADEFDEARILLRRLRERAEQRAEDSALPWIFANLSLVEFLSGDWDAAMQLAQEGHEVALQVGQEPQRLFSLGMRALVRASRGQIDGARADAELALELAEERGVMIATILASSALGLLELSLERPEAAHRILGPLVERLEQGGVREPGSARFVPDEIEALIALGKLAEAERVLARLERRARRLDRASAIAVAQRCRGMLSAARGDTKSALVSLERALAEHERVPMPFERGRTLLALGRTRRRTKLKRAARVALEESAATFEAMGARLWTEIARAELARVGGRRPSSDELTPTERLIAELVAEGHTDKEVAAALFVTPKTVSTGLSRIYRKVGVHSRTSLAARLRNAPGQRKV
jgi:DNA-binding CsgD family transcriptional regulator/tetratricopeptide (TPR) repeat protein